MIPVPSDPAPQFFEEEDPQAQSDFGGNVDVDKQKHQLPQQQNVPEPQLKPQRQPKSQPPEQRSSQQKAKELGKLVSSSTNSTSSSFTTMNSALDAKAQERSEKKRIREKQRRTDVIQNFSDLTELLHRIHDEENKGEEEATKLFLSSFKSNHSGLISHTIRVLERIHNSSKRRKQEVKKLKQEIEQVRKASEEKAAQLKESTLPTPGSGKCMMMVPVMMSPDGHTPMMMPQLMQQPFCPIPSQFASGSSVPLLSSTPVTASSPLGDNNAATAADTTHVVQTSTSSVPSLPSDSQPTHAVQTSTSSVLSPPTPRTYSSGDAENLVHCV